MKLSVKNGLFFGLLFGVIAALLYAPKPGKELRHDLKEKIDTVPKHFLSFLESLVDLMVSVLDFGMSAFQEQSSRLSKAVTTGVNAAKEKANELKTLAAHSANK